VIRKGTLDTKGWQAFGENLKQRGVTTLTITQQKLDTLDVTSWQVFWEGLKDSGVETIIFRDINLSTLSDEQAQAWVKGLQGTCLQRLDIYPNDNNLLKTLSIFVDEHALPLDLALHFLDRSLLTSLSKDIDKTTLSITLLDVSNLELADKDMEDMLVPLLTDTFTSVKTLDMGHNQLTLKGFRSILTALEKGALKHLHTLSVAHNYIELYSLTQLEGIENKLTNSKALKNLDLTGNLIGGKKRDKRLAQMLGLLIQKSGLTVKAFFNTTFISLTKVDSSTYTLTLETPEKTQVTLSLDVQELHHYNAIKQKYDLRTDSGVFDYLLKPSERLLEIDNTLLDNKLDTDTQKQQQQVKYLLDYHPNSPLSSQLNTHPILQSRSLQQAASLLFKENVLTLEHGWVYLVVNPKTEHTRLVYEYLTTNGQRFMKTAHLTVQGQATTFFQKGGQIVIDFEDEKNLFDQIEKYKARYQIAGLKADRGKLKKLHETIVDERDKGINSQYKWFISGKSSTQEPKDIKGKKIQNCLKWATDHLKDELGISLSISLYNPSSVVYTLNTNPESLLQGKEKIETVGNSIEQDNSTNTRSCNVM
jgi:hypothetical protein